MQCVCCLLEADDKKKLTAFTAGDKKCYQELTRLELQAGNAKFRICPICKSLLRASTEFLRQCLKSHVDLPPAIIPPVTKSQRPKRKRNSTVEELEPDESQVSHLECSIADDPGSEDDELPISSLRKQLQVEEPEAFVVIPVDVVDNIKQETSPDATRRGAKYQCTECDLCFSTSQRLQVHSFTHSGIKNWKCGECEKVFATKFRLKAHSRIHTGERPFTCDVCLMSFAQGNALTCHKRIHTKERPFVCKICTKSFAQNTTLKTHMAALHLGKSVECDEPGCSKKFTRRSYLLIHKRDHAGERKYGCDRCPLQYKQKSHLDRHIEATHLGIRHKCDFPDCTAEFSKSWSLKMHKYVHASKGTDLPYQCPTCSAGFQRRDKLLKHIAREHMTDSDEIQVTDAVNQENESFVVLSTSPEIYTIQNLDGSLTQVQTLEVVEEN